MSDVQDFLAKLDFQLKELVDRTRRIETRLTGYLEAQGHDTSVRRPVWSDDVQGVVVPSLQTSIKDVLEVIPADHVAPVVLLHRAQMIARITVPTPVCG